MPNLISHRRTCIARTLALLAALSAFSLNAHAQTSPPAAWPTREIKIVIGFSPGGTTDIITRTLAPELTKLWGQAIVIENRTGAGGNIGGELVAKSKPDGYTLFMGSVGPLAVNASLYKAMPFDNLKDLTPISFVADVPNMLVYTPKALPAANFKEFVALLKAGPGKYFYGSTGSGTTSHLAGELLKAQAGVDITHVPYKGAVALNDVLAGESVHFMFATIPSAIQHVRSGKLRAVAVTSLKRSAGVPDVPTVAESGFAGFEDRTWIALLAPAATPVAVVARVNAEIDKLLQAAEIRERLTAIAFDAHGGTPQAFAQMLRSEQTKFARFVRETGVRGE